MALAVDTGGKVKANPSTGKVFNNSKPVPVSSGGGFRNVLGNIFDAMVQTASMPSRKPDANVLTTPSPQTPSPHPVASWSAPKTTSQQMSLTPKVTASQPVGLAGSTGNEKDATTDAFGLGLDRVDPGPVWEKEAADREGREERTENYFGEQYEQGGGGWYPMMQNVYYGNTPQNDAYLRNAMENGLSEDEAYDIAHYDPRTMGDIRAVGSDASPLSESESYGTNDQGVPLYDPQTLRDHGAWSEAVIDDGTDYDYAHMTSEWMTGPQYKKYVEMGMGGRPVDSIDPAQVYSKVDEAREYDFVPYMPNQVTYNRFAAGDAFRIPGELGTTIANARTILAPDYSITYGKDGTTINGNEFDRRAGTFLNNYYHDLQYDPERLRRNGNPSSVLEYAIPNADGGTSYAYGGIVDSGYDDTLHLSFSDGTEMDVGGDELATWDHDQDGLLIVPDEYVRQHGDFDASYDDTLYLTFADGQRIGLSPDYVSEHTDSEGFVDLDPLYSMTPIDQVSGTLPEDLSVLGQKDVGYEPVLTMSDGTTIPLRDVERIYFDESADNDPDEVDESGNVTRTDDDIRYDFGPFGFSKPRRLMDQEPFDFSGKGEVFNKDDLLNNVADWTFGSVPISMGMYMPWVYSASQATNSMYGIDPGSYNPETGSRGLTAGGWDDNGNLRYGVQDVNGVFDDDLTESTRMWNTAGNAAIPLTEMMVGPVGEHIIPLEGITRRIPFKTDTGRLIADTLVGYGAEGVEEDLGNVFEDLMQYGPSGMFANAVLDENGQPIRDIYGHEVRNENTSIPERFMNFVDPTSMSNAFLGGALVSPAMGLMTAPINNQSFLRNIGPAVSRDYARNLTGVNRYVETDLERDVREALEEGRIPDIPASRSVSDEYASRFNNTIGDR